MGRSSNYNQARQKSLQRQNIDVIKAQAFTLGRKFPSCFSKYPDCPEEAKAFAENKGKTGYKKDDAPRACQLCPFFKW